MASKWIQTACGMCYVRCGIRVLVEDGEEALGTIVAKLEEIRDDPKKLHIQAWEITQSSAGALSDRSEARC
jgi:anaerobic selenocysteine-containing dehydrogenase